jgi:hypothetical protein
VGLAVSWNDRQIVLRVPADIHERAEHLALSIQRRRARQHIRGVSTSAPPRAKGAREAVWDLTKTALQNRLFRFLPLDS